MKLGGETGRKSRSETQLEVNLKFGVLTKHNGEPGTRDRSPRNSFEVHHGTADLEQRANRDMDRSIDGTRPAAKSQISGVARATGAHSCED